MRLLPPSLEALRRDAGVSRAIAAVAIFGVWLIPASLAAIETWIFSVLAQRPYELWVAWALQTPPWLVYAVATPFILHASERLPVRGRRAAVALIAHVALGLLIGVAYAVVAALNWRIWSTVPDTITVGRHILSWFLSGLPLMALSYAAVAGSGRALAFFGRTRAAELAAARLGAQLSDARLSTLRMQLHPHFLFNTLNAITVFVRDGDRESAERTLELLSDLLRTSLRDAGVQRIPLHEELDFNRRYIELERIRFADRLRIRFDIDPATEHALVPVMVLQPLIENALRHGIARSADAGLLTIVARRTADVLRVTVRDDGPGPGGTTGGRGMGLGNTRERLKVLYGESAGLTLERAGTETAATLTLPFTTHAPADER